MSPIILILLMQLVHPVFTFHFTWYWYTPASPPNSKINTVVRQVGWPVIQNDWINAPVRVIQVRPNVKLRVT